MKRLETFSAVAAVAGGLLLFQSPAQGALFNNLDVFSSGGNTANPDLWLAQSFNSGSETVLTGVTLNLYNGNSEPFNVELYGSTGVEKWPLDLNIAPFGITPFSSPESNDPDNLFPIGGLSIPLTPNTDYYIVLKPASGNIGMTWGYTESPTGTEGDTYYTYNDVLGSYGDPGWADPIVNSNPQRMAINPVPEASTWVAVAFLGVLGVGRFGRKLFTRFARN